MFVCGVTVQLTRWRTCCVRRVGTVGRVWRVGLTSCAPQDADHLTSAVHLEVTEASQAAIAAIEAKGGSVVTVYNSALSLRALLKPEKFAVVPKTPAPPPKAMSYYISDANRGYLSRLVQLKRLEKSSTA